VIDFNRKKGFVCDMDGVIFHGDCLLPGAKEFSRWLISADKQFLFLTNSSQRSPRQLRDRLGSMGIDIQEDNFYTSALATADFLSRQLPGAKAYVIGEYGLTTALQEAGLVMDDRKPDYVVVGETQGYNFEKITRAINLVLKGARLIGTNPDTTGPSEEGVVPGTGAIIAPIEKATERRAYFIGKPNPLIMRHSLKRLGCRREETVIIGDRMDTDVIAGIESEIATVLVLSGVTGREDILRFPYRPDLMLEGVGDILTAAATS
jgi:NagD protein